MANWNFHLICLKFLNMKNILIQAEKMLLILIRKCKIYKYMYGQWVCLNFIYKKKKNIQRKARRKGKKMLSSKLFSVAFSNPKWPIHQFSLDNIQWRNGKCGAAAYFRTENIYKICMYVCFVFIWVSNAVV